MVKNKYDRIKESNSRANPPSHHHDLFHKLRKIRIAKRISQHDLAVKIGVHAHEMHRYERRQVIPSADTFLAWLEALDFKIVAPELYDGYDYEI
jgi:transcriptional regulator with XRE-family HTH domain